MARLSFGRGAIKPPAGAMVNLEHQFARGLVICAPLNEYGSYTNDSTGPGFIVTTNLFVGSGATPRLGLTQNNRPVFWTSNREGPSLLLNDYLSFTGSLAYIGLGSGAAFPSDAVTICVVRRKVDTTARNAVLFGTGTNGASVFPFSGNGSLIRAYAPWSDGHVYWEFGDTSAGGQLDIAGLSFTTAEERWIFTAGPAGSAVWRNGIKVGSNSTVGSRNSSGTSTFYLGNFSSLTQADHQEINFFHSVGVQWSDDLCRWWSAEPYAHLYTPRNKAPLYFALGSPPAPFLTINGLEVTPRMETFRLTKAAGRPARCTFVVVSIDGTYRPAEGDEVIVTENGTDRLFAGLIEDTDESGLDRVHGTTATLTSVAAGSYAAYADWRTNVTETFAAQDLATTVEALRVAYLDIYGVTLDAGQVAGPTLEATSYSGLTLRQVFDDLAQRSGGYVWRIDDYKVLSFFLPTAAVAPFDITTANALAELDVRVHRTGRERANKVFLKFGGNGVRTVTKHFVGDGVTDTFAIGLPITGPLPPTDPANACGYAIVNISGTESLGGLTSPDIWLYDPVGLTIFRTLGPPALGLAFYITFDTSFPATVSAVDAAWSTLPREKTVERPNLDDVDIAQALVDELLAIALVSGVEVNYQTASRLIEPGMTQTIDLAARGIASATYTVTQVETVNTRGNLIRRFVTATAGSVARPEFLPVATYEQWMGVTS